LYAYKYAKLRSSSKVELEIFPILSKSNILILLIFSASESIFSNQLFSDKIQLVSNNPHVQLAHVLSIYTHPEHTKWVDVQVGIGGGGVHHHPHPHQDGGGGVDLVVIV